MQPHAPPRRSLPSLLAAAVRWLATGSATPPAPCRPAVRERAYDRYVRTNRGGRRAG